MRKQPDNNKYHFGSLENGENKVVPGTYRLIRIAAMAYGNVHGKKFLVKKLEQGAVVQRFK